jgi:hypothetical protein
VQKLEDQLEASGAATTGSDEEIARAREALSGAKRVLGQGAEAGAEADAV